MTKYCKPLLFALVRREAALDPGQIPVVVINALWLDLDAHAIPTGWVFMLERMLTAGPM